MCTVSLFPVDASNFVLTSNRDESPDRLALPPSFYDVENTKLLFPKDPLSGGTWIGVSEKKRVVCLLNGGFNLHERKGYYRKSRGLVTQEVMLMDEVTSDIEHYNFIDIEPFTMIIVDWNSGLSFYELIWDGERKHFSELPLEPRIWSSSTLYTEAMKSERKLWFDDFVMEQELNAQNVLSFHKSDRGNQTDYGVIMDRGFVKTTSITQVSKQNEAVAMYFETIADKQFSVETFHFNTPVVNG